MAHLSIRRTLMDLPIPKKLALLIGLFCAVVGILLLLSYFGMEILSGTRAYVGGEGLWSKAQKAAVYRLTRYALFQEEADYQKYLQHIAIPLGDHLARIEMEKPEMNYDNVIKGFVQGRNHPNDVRIMTLMARRLYRVPTMSKVIAIWGQADQELSTLIPVADRLREEITSGRRDPAKIKALLEQIRAIDDRLGPLEDDFSFTLGSGARWLKNTLLVLMGMTTCVFLGFALWAAFWISKQLCAEIDQLRAGAARIASGDYSHEIAVDSKDEVGDLARSFREMATQRQRAERLKDEFFANVSHELRTPLTLILSPLESLLADRKVFDAGTQSVLETMHNNTVRLLQMVNGLLDFAKLEAGKIQVQREPLRIMDLTNMIYRDFKPLIQERGLQVQLQLDPPEASVLMDRHLYERIFFNLLSNAVKFTPSGGRIDIRLRWQNDQLTLTVADTGIGIADNERHTIFQRFRQVEGSSTRRFEGTGLGLALVKEFATLLGGSITLDSTPSKGSTFTVTCQAPRAAEAPLALTLDPLPKSLRAKQFNPTLVSTKAAAASRKNLPKVLIAEDNPEMSDYIVSLIQELCQTQIARDGNEALTLAKQWNPDLILTDVMMPERDGLSLCRELRTIPTTAETPIVMLTALTHREALMEGWKAGASDYLFKPFHPKELLARVNSLLKMREIQKQADARILQLNENLKQRAADLEIANQEMEAFSYSVSHDLRSPLRAIDGFSRELIENCSTLSESNKKDLQRVRVATQRMAQLIDDLLELSRLSRAPIHRETVNLSEVAKDIVQDLKGIDPKRHVEVQIASNLQGNGDPHLLRVVMDNLLRNAWKFTQPQAEAKIEVGVVQKDGCRTFYVRDNGVGFNMNYSDKLFKAFQRLHEEKDFPGTGIGLALVQRIIQHHGGTVWAEAKERHGATFSFTLS